jgi:hypothetical protein
MDLYDLRIIVWLFINKNVKMQKFFNQLQKMFKTVKNYFSNTEKMGKPCLTRIDLRVI